MRFNVFFSIENILTTCALLLGKYSRCSSFSPVVCLIYVISVCLLIVVSNTDCAVFLFSLTSFCVLCSICCPFLWVVNIFYRFSITFIYVKM